MKVLLIITGLFPGGAERIVLETVRGLLKYGHRPTAVSLLPEPEGNGRRIVNELNELGVRTFYLNLSLFRFYRVFFLLKIIRREAPDVVHSHLMHANLAARLMRFFLRFPLINTIHIAERRGGMKIKLLFLLDRLTFRFCDICTAVSQAAARFHERICHLPAGSILTVYNGSDPAEPKTPDELAAIRREWGLENTAELIGSIGRLDYQKGYDLLLRSLSSLQKLIPAGETWGLVLIGDGPERAGLQSLAREMEQKIPAVRIVFPGYRPDASSLLPMLDLFVMPSRYEGFGLALTEALSQGVPALCSQADSLPEICAEFPENTLTADFSSPDLTESFRKALSLPRLPGKIFRSTDEMTREYLNLYRKISGEE